MFQRAAAGKVARGGDSGNNRPMDENALAGKRILIVEDEYFLASDLARLLKDRGAEVVGPAANLPEAERLVGEGGLDCAVLDMNLRGEMTFPIADRLKAAGIPFLIATGYNSASLPERFATHPRIEKPFEAEQIATAIPALLS